jgi:hypothetical protein
MLYKSKLILLGTITILFGGITGQSVIAKDSQVKIAQSQSETEAELVGIAEAAVASERYVQVTGDSDEAKKRHPRSGKIRDAKFQERLAKAKERRRLQRERKIAFKNSQTKLTVKKLSISGDTAILEASEDTTKYYDRSIMTADAPEKSEEVVEHRFTFEKRGGQWGLVSSEVINGPGAIQSKPQESIPVLPTNPNVAPSDPLAPPTNPGAQSQSPLNSTSLNKTASLNGKIDGASHPSTSNKIAQSSLNRSAIVQYIYYYAKTPNSKYRDYTTSGGDCTNFVSQALRAGGWSDVSGAHNSTASWWYDFSILSTLRPASWTWTSADYFFKFIQGKPRAKTIGRVADLVPGDVISVDLDPANNNGIDHTMLVSKKDSAGNIYLAYHTSNALDKTFYDFYQASPSTAKYYAWSLLSSFQ